MAKTQKPLIFIDTNIFLGFYRAESEASLSLLQHIESIPEALITTDQFEMEFLNNRQRVISAALQSLKAPSLPPFVPAYLSDSRAASKIEKNLNEMKKQMAALKRRLAKILEHPALHDPVFKMVKKAFSFHSPMNLKFCDAKLDLILDRALRRFQRGLPPRKRDDTSFGDAVNWEWIVECAIGTGKDVVIVSRDGDYGLRLDGRHYLNDCLLQEFKERVSAKRKADFTTSLVQALRNLAIPVTKAEEEEEQKIIAKQATPPAQPISNFLFDHLLHRQLLHRIRQKAPSIHLYLSQASQVSLTDQALTFGFDRESADVIGLVDNPHNRDLLETELKSMGHDGLRVRFLLLQDGSPTQTSSAPIANSSEENLPF